MSFEDTFIPIKKKPIPKPIEVIDIEIPEPDFDYLDVTPTAPSRTIEEIRRETEASRQRIADEEVVIPEVIMPELPEAPTVSSEEQQKQELIEMVKESGTTASLTQEQRDILGLGEAQEPSIRRVTLEDQGIKQETTTTRLTLADQGIEQPTRRRITREEAIRQGLVEPTRQEQVVMELKDRVKAENSTAGLTAEERRLLGLAPIAGPKEPFSIEAVKGINQFIADAKAERDAALERLKGRSDIFAQAERIRLQAEFTTKVAGARLGELGIGILSVPESLFVPETPDILTGILGEVGVTSIFPKIETRPQFAPPTIGGRAPIAQTELVIGSKEEAQFLKENPIFTAGAVVGEIITGVAIGKGIEFVGKGLKLTFGKLFPKGGRISQPRLDVSGRRLPKPQKSSTIFQDDAALGKPKKPPSTFVRDRPPKNVINVPEGVDVPKGGVSTGPGKPKPKPKPSAKTDIAFEDPLEKILKDLEKEVPLVRKERTFKVKPRRDVPNGEAIGRRQKVVLKLEEPKPKLKLKSKTQLKSRTKTRSIFEDEDIMARQKKIAKPKAKTIIVPVVVPRIKVKEKSQEAIKKEQEAAKQKAAEEQKAKQRAEEKAREQARQNEADDQIIKLVPAEEEGFVPKNVDAVRPLIPTRVIKTTPVAKLKPRPRVIVRQVPRQKFPDIIKAAPKELPKEATKPKLVPRESLVPKQVLKTPRGFPPRQTLARRPPLRIPPTTIFPSGPRPSRGKRTQFGFRRLKFRAPVRTLRISGGGPILPTGLNLISGKKTKKLRNRFQPNKKKGFLAFI